MKRTPQEIVELVVFGLIALLIGTGVLWLLGAVFGLVGTVLGWLAALLWGLLAFLVPVALVAGAIVLVVRWAQGRPLPGSPDRPVPAAAPAPTAAGAATAATAAPAAPAAAAAAAAPAAPAAAAAAVEPVPPTADASLDRERAADATAEGMPPAPAGTPPVVAGAPTDGIDASETAENTPPDGDRRDDA